MTALLSFEGVSLELDGAAILREVSLAVEPGAVVALAGPSGSGKTSLLRIALGLLAPSAGRVRLRGNVVSEEGRVVMPPEERRLAMVFQDLALWPHLSVGDNLGFALEVQGVSKAERGRRIAETLSSVALPGLEQRAPASLSGGERQRVALARALVTKPDIVLFDEPLANLDVALRLEMLALVRELLSAAGASALYVTHDPAEARALATEVVVLEGGRVAARGTLAALARDPATPFVRAFTR